MKNILLLVTVFLAGHLFSQTEEWLNLGTDAKQSTYYYKPHSTNKAWIKIASPQITYYDNGKNKTVDGYQLNLWLFDCEEKQIGVVQTTTYDKSGNVLRTLHIKSYEIELQYVNPNSIGENFLQAFCKK
ncbi:MAG: hypothetical protein K0M63_05850 [Weeksellaceae bacterium]|nr:hypothetical protein [Weeksellaceae bacterium]